MGAVSQFEDILDRLNEGLADCSKVLARGGTLGERKTRELSEFVAACDRLLRELTAVKPLVRSTKTDLALQVKALKGEGAALRRENKKLIGHLREAERNRLALEGESVRERKALTAQLAALQRQLDELRSYRSDPQAFYDKNPPLQKPKRA